MHKGYTVPYFQDLVWNIDLSKAKTRKALAAAISPRLGTKSQKFKALETLLGGYRSSGTTYVTTVLNNKSLGATPRIRIFRKLCTI